MSFDLEQNLIIGYIVLGALGTLFAACVIGFFRKEPDDRINRKIVNEIDRILWARGQKSNLNGLNGYGDILIELDEVRLIVGSTVLFRNDPKLYDIGIEAANAVRGLFGMPSLERKQAE